MCKLEGVLERMKASKWYLDTSFQVEFCIWFPVTMWLMLRQPPTCIEFWVIAGLSLPVLVAWQGTKFWLWTKLVLPEHYPGHRQ